ncbi:MAG: alkaline phosphatase D family protein [Solirubrobacteraceae bacterium]
MLSRRQFLARSGATGAALVFAPDALAAPKLLRGGKFTSGVISGDPTPTGITLWTRVDGAGGTGGVRLEVARDRGFRHVVAHRTLTARERADHAVKARIGGLKPHERYYYRFETKGEDSPVGRFQTALPKDSRETVRFAFFSCQEYSFGYFNAHARLAHEDVDFVVNLGDYIYSDVSLAPPLGVRDPKFVLSGGFSAVTKDEYRDRYKRYREDSSLRKMHAQFPMISLWDDHEVQNDYAGGDPAGGGVTGDPYSPARRNLAYDVFFEQMPTFPVRRSGHRLYHSARFGRMVDLFVLDERQYRAAQPCGDARGPACDELGNPRPFLGAQQLAFARGGIKRSKAAWKVIANEVVMMPIKVTTETFDAFDAWHGYPVEREALLRTVKGVDDVVFITGDYHAFIAGDVQTADGRTVATEFVGGSVSSSTEPEINSIIKLPGWGTPDAPAMPPDELARRKAANPWYAELDYLHHGYVVCEASKSSFKATFRKLQTVRRRSTALASSKTYTVKRGHAGL